MSKIAKAFTFLGITGLVGGTVVYFLPKGSEPVVVNNVEKPKAKTRDELKKYQRCLDSANYHKGYLKKNI